MPSWEEMCQELVVAGRPGDVASAALGWEQLLKNLNAVKESLEKNVTDLGDVWKGPAYESFKTHVKGLATTTGQIVDDAEKHNGIVQSLRTAADKLSAAQADFPIPASCVNDVLEARNGRLVIGAGFFEMKVKPDFLGLLDPLTSLADWINDKSDEAAKVYNQVRGEYLTVDSGTPGDGRPSIDDRGPDVETPNLDKPGPVKPIGANPDIGNPNIKTPDTKMPDIGSNPPDVTKPDFNTPDTKTPDIGSGTHPDLSGDYRPPGTGSLADDYGSGLAGAGAPTVPTLGGGGGGLPGTSGLGSGAGLGSGGGGLGGGMIPGGGSLGRPVSPNMGPMMGGGAAGANRGGGRGAGGRLGAGGKLGAGGMSPMMGGAAGGAGRGGGGRAGAAGAGAKGAGAGARGVGGMGGMGGAGYGEEETARNTWLEEDDDVWGADGGGTPGILR
ncbi:hypothetical protein [Micromonospora peucetia]|uniref:WXG100 family type VII secretion target n=1 Tax=Micromonospora peucetia TaxID=47871 RepID=A0ABZ1EJI2_9ACTN|nr:hypothetical protein [Micromonospora peucetia]WSA34391.1 hypothetical protein OIE14_10275 [Micromonospora peucetia]